VSPNKEEGEEDEEEQGKGGGEKRLGQQKQQQQKQKQRRLGPLAVVVREDGSAVAKWPTGGDGARVVVVYAWRLQFVWMAEAVIFHFFLLQREIFLSFLCHSDIFSSLVHILTAPFAHQHTSLTTISGWLAIPLFFLWCSPSSFAVLLSGTAVSFERNSISGGFLVSPFFERGGSGLAAMIDADG